MHFVKYNETRARLEESCNAFLRIISISDECRDASADEELVRRTFRDIADT